MMISNILVCLLQKCLQDSHLIHKLFTYVLYWCNLPLLSHLCNTYKCTKPGKCTLIRQIIENHLEGSLLILSRQQLLTLIFKAQSVKELSPLFKLLLTINGVLHLPYCLFICCDHEGRFVHCSCTHFNVN